MELPSLAPLPEKQPLPFAGTPDGNSAFMPKGMDAPSSLHPDGTIDFDLTEAEKDFGARAFENRVNLGGDGHIPTREEKSGAVADMAESPSDDWLTVGQEGPATGRTVGEIRSGGALEAGGTFDRDALGLEPEASAPRPESITVAFDLKAMQEKMTIRKKAYFYARGKADDPENAPLREAFLKEVDSSREKYRTTLDEVRLKLAEMIKYSEGDAKKLLVQEFTAVVRELGALDQGDVEEAVSAEAA